MSVGAEDGGLVIAASDGSTDDVYERLRAAILSGEIRPGLEISQVALARALGVSTTPLREAVRMLQLEGLVETQRNKRLHISTLSIADMDELYCSRILLDSFALRVTLPRLTVEDLADLEGSLAQMLFFAGEENYPAWEVPHRAFHSGLSKYVGDRMRTTLRQMSDHGERYRWTYTTGTPRAWDAGKLEHREILDAVRQRDVELACHRLASHLAHTVYGIVETFEPDHDPASVSLAVTLASRHPGRSDA